MTMNLYDALWECHEHGTAFYEVWVDRTQTGLVFHRNVEPGPGCVDEWTCVNPGITTIANFFSRTDLPRGTRMLATDRAMSLWQFDGVAWIPLSEYTGTLNTTAADLNLLPIHNGMVIVNGGSTNRAVNYPNGMPVPFRVKLVQLASGKLNIIPAGAPLVASALGGANKTTGPGARALIEQFDPTTVLLSGNIST